MACFGQGKRGSRLGPGSGGGPGFAKRTHIVYLVSGPTPPKISFYVEIGNFSAPSALIEHILLLILLKNDLRERKGENFTRLRRDFYLHQVELALSPRNAAHVYRCFMGL